MSLRGIESQLRRIANALEVMAGTESTAQIRVRRQRQTEREIYGNPDIACGKQICGLGDGHLGKCRY